MGEVYNDGTVQYGSRDLDIVTSITSTAAIGTYVADNVNVTRAVNKIKRTDKVGSPSGSVGVSGDITGTATLQLANSSAKEPVGGNAFSVTLDSTIGTEVFVIQDVTRAESKEAEKKINITFEKKYSA